MGVYGRSMVKMAAESNMDFNQDAILASALNQDSIPFQSGAINSMSGMITAGRSLGIGSPSGTILSGNASITSTPRFAASGNSSGGLLLDKMPGLKHDTGMAVDWSIEEQSKLDEGLVKYADEPNIMKYIKIAALLRDKTVRDVALRSQWIMKKENGKRRKHEEYNIGKKMKEWRENIVEASSKTNTPLALQLNRPRTWSLPPSHSSGISGSWSDLPADIHSELVQAFRLIDRDGDGKITTGELHALLSRLGVQPVSEDELSSMVTDVDRDGDGCVSLEEFGAISSAFAPACGSELRDVFEFFDADKDGKISAEELLGVFEAIGDERCTLADCRRMICGVDSDGDGFVCFEDFTRMMERQR